MNEYKIMQMFKRREKEITSKWAIAVFIVIAALMIPQALAVSTGLSGNCRIDGHKFSIDRRNYS
jgi:hypothetical protein